MTGFSNYWVGWALLSALFAAATALLAKVGVAHVDSNLATAIRTSVVVVFAWAIAIGLGKHGEIRLLDRRTLFFPGAFRRRNWPVVDLLLPRASTGAGFARCAIGQAQRPAGDGLCLASVGGKA